MPKTSPKPELRAEVLMRSARGESLSQIGRALGITRNAVSGFRHRERERIKKQIEQKVLPAMEKELVDAI